MTRMGMSDGEKLGIYGIVAGVLHLGNVCFEDDAASKGMRLAVFGVVVSEADHEKHDVIAGVM